MASPGRSVSRSGTWTAVESACRGRKSRFAVIGFDCGRRWRSRLSQPPFRVWVGGVCERGGEEAVGPLFGEAAGVGEDEVDFGVAHLEPGELVGKPVAVDVLQLVESRVSALDDDGGEGKLGESLQLESERSVGERGGEVVEALSLDGGKHGPVACLDCVVARGNGLPHRLGSLLAEAVRVALPRVDRDRDRVGEGAPAGYPAAGIGGPRGLLRLPEDRLASLHLRENDLGAGTPRSVKDEVDRRSAPTAEQDRRLLDDLRVLGPGLLEAVAVDARGRRPRLPRLQHQPALERQPVGPKYSIRGTEPVNWDPHPANTNICSHKIGAVQTHIK